jgi:multidrug efflux pump subunit AcrB
MRGLFTAFARNTVFSNIVLLIIIFAGVLATLNMRREFFPEFSLDMISVTMVWPGADPEEVEEGIVRKMEERIDGLVGVKQYNSVSAEGRGTVMVEVEENADMDDVKERVRNAVESVSNFPEDAERPVIEEIILRQEVMQLSVVSEQASERQLKEQAEGVKDDIRALEGVSQAQILGARDYEISIEVSEERLRQYGLSFEQVARAVRMNSLNIAGGTVRTEGEEIRLRTLGRKYTGEEFANIIVLSGPKGEQIPLDRIATVKDAFTEDPVISRLNGERCVSVVILQTPDEDAITVANAVKGYVEKKRTALPSTIRMEIWGDASTMLSARISLLSNNGLIGIMLVFVLLWLFLDLRLSFWTGMGMPISVLGALAIMWAVDATINMISLFGLIMVLGIIVDDAIVVGESIYVHRKMGKSALQAAIDGTMEVWLPVVAAVTTTIVAFIPLLFVGGIMGKFIAILPVVVIACLAISLVESLVLLPAHLNHLPDPNRVEEHGHPLRRLGKRFHKITTGGLEWFVHRLYTPFLEMSLNWRYTSLAVAITVFMVAIGLAGSGIVKFEVFPRVDGDLITATVEFPDGTPLETTQAAVKQLEDAILRIAERTDTISGAPLIEHVYSLVGSDISEGMPRRGNHLGAVRLELLDTELRGVSSEGLMAEWEQEVGRIPGVVALSFLGMQAGPPGAPIEVWLQGDDIGQLVAASNDLMEKLENYEGVYQIQSDFRPSKNEVKLRLKPEARALGISVADLGSQVYAGYFGEEAVRIQRGRDDIRVRVRYPEEERNRIAELEQVRIRTAQGDEVPLLSVADLDYGPGYTTINRTDGLRRVSVTAELRPGQANATEIFAALESDYFPSLEREYPALMVRMQGEQKKSRESLGSLFTMYPLALMGIYIIIATIFRSYVQPMLIMLTVPFGIIGAILGHLVLGFNLSMMSIFGMVALSGVVVNDAIVLIEYINSRIAKGVNFHDAIVQGGTRRFRAVFLTTITTAGGLAPLIMEKDMQAQFLIPMAISLAAGVAFATMLTLLLLPCLLYILNDLRRVVHWLTTYEWPDRDLVEPARLRDYDPEAETPGIGMDEAAAWDDDVPRPRPEATEDHDEPITAK